MGVLADATKARMQLQDLATRGFPVSWISEQIGVAPQGLNRTRRGERRRIYPYTATCVDRLYRQLADTSPASHGIAEGFAQSTRLRAVRKGWTT